MSNFTAWTAEELADQLQAAEAKIERLEAEVRRLRGYYEGTCNRFDRLAKVAVRLQAELKNKQLSASEMH